MDKRQRGVTMIGFVLIAAMVAIIGYAAIRLGPIYLNQMNVRKVLNQVKEQNDNNGASPKLILSSIEKGLDSSYVDFPTARNFVVTKTDTGYLVTVSYEDRAAFLANISLVAVFDNSVEIER